MRLFVALVPPAEVMAALPILPDGLRPVSADQIHLTLAFLGEQPAAHAIAASLDRAVSGAAPLLQLAGAGSFGSAVWLGLQGDLDRLAELARSVQHAVRSAGVVLEDRRWQPHLTVGRTRGRPGPHAGRPSALFGDLRSYAGPRGRWNEVRLVHSRLGRASASHETIARWHLDD